MNLKDFWNQESTTPVKFSWFFTYTVIMVIGGFIVGLVLGINL